jgi:hypothetical protein
MKNVDKKQIKRRSLAVATVFFKKKGHHWRLLTTQ